MAGLTSTGFTAKRFDQILTSIKAALKPAFGSGVDTSEDSIVMQIVNPIALEIEEGWQGTQKVYDSMNPNHAEGVALDNIGAITSVPRVQGAKSTVIVDCEGSEGSVIPKYFQLAVETTGEIFQTKASHTLPAVGSQPLQITMEAINDGPVMAIAGTLNQGTLPSGVTSMENATDASVGTYDETDEDYRIGRKERLAQIAAATVLSIKSSLLNSEWVPDVSAAKVFENDTGEVDVMGSPPHSIRCLVFGGADQDIIDVIGVKKGAGTYTDGTVSGTFTDPDDGQEFPIRFTRVTLSEIYVTVEVTGKTDNYPVTGDQDIKDNILALIWDIGEDVTLPKLQGAIVSVPGITEYTVYFATTDPPLTDTNIIIAPDVLADLDSTRVTVTS